MNPHGSTSRRPANFMNKNKIVYIIPGYGESHKRQGGYNKVAKFFNAQGIKAIHIKINWHKQKPRSFENYVKQFLKQYKKPKNTKVYTLGFSYGAVIAFLTAAKTKPTNLILCSLSPYFKEDQRYLKPAWLKWWRKTFIESNYLFKEFTPKIKAKTYLIVGERESSVCLRRATDANKRISKSHLIIAKGAKHNISQKEYLRSIEELIVNL